MDSGNIAETLGETTQPVDGVVLNTEGTEAKPQAEATEEVEFYVEAEGDQSTEPKKMDERKTHAAWLEEKNKRKKKEIARLAEKERADRLEVELEEVKSKINSMSKGKRPDPYDFNSTEEYYKADDEWRNQGSSAPKPVAQVAKQAPAVVLTDEQEYHLHQSELGLKKSLKDYDDVRERVSEGLARTFNGDGPTLINALSAIAHTFDVDPAKAFYALEKVPGKMEELLKYSNNQAQIGRILRDLESKVKVRERKPIDSKPEPNIKGGGPVNLMQKEVDNAFKAYTDNPTTQTHQLLTAARKRVKQAKVS